MKEVGCLSPNVFYEFQQTQTSNSICQPATQAVVESMKRAFDGTFADKLDSVLGHLGGLSLNEQIKMLVADIVGYCVRVDSATEEQIDRAIRGIWKGQKGIKMIKPIRYESMLQGIEIGEARGEARGQLRTILAIVKTKFKRIPKHVREALNKMTDPVALESLAVHAAMCDSMEEFENALK